PALRATLAALPRALARAGAALGRLLRPQRRRRAVRDFVSRDTGARRVGAGPLRGAGAVRLAGEPGAARLRPAGCDSRAARVGRQGDARAARLRLRIGRERPRLHARRAARTLARVDRRLALRLLAALAERAREPAAAAREADASRTGASARREQADDPVDGVR